MTHVFNASNLNAHKNAYNKALEEPYAPLTAEVLGRADDTGRSAGFFHPLYVALEYFMSWLLNPGPFHLWPEEQAVVDNLVDGARAIASSSVDATTQQHKFNVAGIEHTGCRKMTTKHGALFEETPDTNQPNYRNIYIEDPNNAGSYILFVSSNFDPEEKKFCIKQETNTCLLDELQKAARQLLKHQKFKASEFESLAIVAGKIKAIDMLEKESLRLICEKKEWMDNKGEIIKIGKKLNKDNDSGEEVKEVLQITRDQLSEIEKKIKEIEKHQQSVKNRCKKLEPVKQRLIKKNLAIFEKANARFEKKQKELDVEVEVDGRNQLEYFGT